MDVIYKETTKSYNPRCYGKPWIAKLTFERPGKPEYAFGDWLGTAGCEGELSIEVEPGDVIATGQKDIRNGRGGADAFGVIQEDGTVQWYGDNAAKARDAGEMVCDHMVR
jgi:hypothetical protein